MRGLKTEYAKRRGGEVLGVEDALTAKLKFPKGSQLTFRDGGAFPVRPHGTHYLPGVVLVFKP
jgi:hypothetical protein